MKSLLALSQSGLSWLLAIYIGFFLNVSVFYRREDAFPFFSNDRFASHVPILVELTACVLFVFFLMRVLSLGGRRFFRITASLLLVISVAASYYMTFFNVVIGYGIIAAVMTTDIDLSKEVVGGDFVIWLVGLTLPALYLIWKPSLEQTLIKQLCTPGKRWSALFGLLVVAIMVWLPLRYLDRMNSSAEKSANQDLPSYGGVVAHSYLPANWLSALGLFAYARYDESQDDGELFDPGKTFTYQPPAGIDETYVVFIIGETTRWDHLGLLGYPRETTPLLAQEPDLLAFRGRSCDTSTKLSMRCMFVREGGAADNPQRTLRERNIFAVMQSLGFSSELFAMQSEVWFYNNIRADSYAFREMIASEKRNEGKAVDDMLLVDELSRSLARYPKGKHLVVLHTKGSHYLYSMRYPRAYARFQPECMGIDATCSREQLINAFDNSVLYTDAFIKRVIDQLRNKKALLVYASDHGESIDENYHLHGTPRQVAPPEQFRSPIMLWASPALLSQPHYQQAFDRLRVQQKQGKVLRHEEIFDSMLGCLGYTSPDGGIQANNNWCG
ncbi:MULTISPECIES: kdo(2)-lipid A phosphoethanolamine 7''-transferase [Dickeya]|uniref:Phosphoethanolamine transferase specific for the outer Kdo residue of lipopolysaccharide n=1 Tax=Dickeya aquatica TaxID=1401087 RepID=A0A375A535_9GAMM|nr:MULTISPECIES: kdo(2)-lipid A phosphoethanolamine 7''-transferase [Dickeya]SLM61188.1 Phosphoethanolamine transferase specific for the outer Kdo residue of lipopolysaccharide [Dickeya aquatica]